MAKKSKNKKKKGNEITKFNQLLADNAKHINVLKNEESKNLVKLTAESVEAVTAVPFDGVIPVSAADVVKDKKCKQFEANVYYTTPVFKLFEMAMSSPVTQNLIITVSADDMEYFFEPGFNETITSMYGKTNLSMILKELQKPKKKLEKWIEADMDEETPYDIFVLNIPDVILFTNKIRKDEISEGIFFNLIVQVVKSKKKIEKLKKKDLIEELSKFIIKCTLENIKNFGCVNATTAITEQFSKDYYEVSENWKILIKADEEINKLVDRLSFTVTNSTGFAIAANNIAELKEDK